MNSDGVHAAGGRERLRRPRRLRRLAPQVFALNDTAHVIGEGPPDLIMDAAETCPSVAIIVIDAETGEQVYP